MHYLPYLVMVLLAAGAACMAPATHSTSDWRDTAAYWDLM